jgi:hypothetical protein
MLLGQSSIAGTVDATAEKATLVEGLSYRYQADVDSVIRYTTAAGSDATATPATGDVFVAAGTVVIVTKNNGNDRLSVVRRAVDGVYTLTPLTGY